MSYEGLKSAQAIYHEWIESKKLPPLTAAGRNQIVQELLKPPVCDDAGNVIGYGPPLITESDALALLSVQDTDAND